MDNLPVPEDARRQWVKAASFPADKEGYYPEHGVVQEFDSHRGKKVLEYGCGGGSDAMSFLRRGNETWFADVVQGNIDMSTSRIAAAGLAEKSHPVYLEYSAPLPFDDNFFDVASSHGVIHHIKTPGPVIAEFHRVLKVGGLLYVMLYAEALWNRAVATIEQRVASGASPDKFHAFCQTTDPGTPYARYYTEAEGREFLSSTGLVMEKAWTWNDTYFRTYKLRKP